MLPETLRLAEYGLGHDERAKVAQSVASRLGPRFLPWQLEQSVEESWAECERHARNLLGAEGYSRLKAEIAQTKSGTPSPGASTDADVVRAGAAPKRLFPGESTLFGDETEDPT